MNDLSPLFRSFISHLELPLFSVIRPVGRSWLVKVGFSSSRCSGLPSEGDLWQRSRRFHIANWECDPRLWAWCKDPATSVSRDWDSCFSPTAGAPSCFVALSLLPSLLALLGPSEAVLPNFSTGKSCSFLTMASEMHIQSPSARRWGLLRCGD